MWCAHLAPDRSVRSGDAGARDGAENIKPISGLDLVRARDRRADPEKGGRGPK